MSQAVFRFAPSPNGELHLGHAYSALLNQQMAREAGGKFLLRIEDIDQVRCTAGFERQMLDDLEWLGLEWDDAPRRQSEHFGEYLSALETLEAEGLIYPSTATRGEIKRQIITRQKTGEVWPHDPDGVPHYPGNERNLNAAEREKIKHATRNYSLRLDMERTLKSGIFANRSLAWFETGQGPEGQTGNIRCEPEQWGDVLLGRKNIPASYHLSCVLDDAIQGITHIVRGQDLFYATSIHRLIQEILGLPVPQYHHHNLVLDEDGHKLSKSRRDTSLKQLRQIGASLLDVKKMLFSDIGNPLDG